MSRRDRTVSLLILGAVGTLFFIFASALFVYTTTQRLVASRDWRDHSQEVLNTLLLTSQRLDRIDFSNRIYLMDKNEDDLATAQSTTIVLDTGLIHLDELVKDNADQANRAHQLHSCALELKALVNEGLAEGKNPHKKVLACRDLVSKTQEAERTVLTERTKESQKNIYRSLLAGGAFLVASLAVVVVLFGFLVRDARRRQKLDEQLYHANSKLEVTVLTMRKHAAETASLMAAREELQLCTTPAQAYEAVVRHSKLLHPSAHTALLMINNSRNMVEIVASEGETRLLDGFTLDACCGLRSGRLRWRKPGRSEVHCNHFVASPPEDYLCIPLAAHGDTLGILYIECPTPLVSIEVERNRESLEALAEITAISVAGLKLRARLEHQSIRDGLTNLFNRHFMEISLDREVRRAARNHTDLSILMLDVDHFKKFNDTYGHEAGDCVLREVAEIFRLSVRAEDIICRYGGEEFVIILPDTSPEFALQRAETIRERTSQLRIRFREEALREITISIGMATYPQSGSTLEEMLRAADRALYTAKHNGRNQVVMSADVAIV